MIETVLTCLSLGVIVIGSRLAILDSYLEAAQAAADNYKFLYERANREIIDLRRRPTSQGALGPQNPRREGR